MGSLRDEQKRIARDRILEALAVEIAEHGLLDLSVPAVAERAGVSQRTVYNYFENKDVLVRSLGEWAEQWMEDHGGRVVETDLDKIPQALEVNFRLMSEMGAVTAAFARIRAEIHRDPEVQRPRGGGHDRRTDAMREGLTAVRPDLDSVELAGVTAIFRTMVSFETWNHLANEFGLSGAEAGRLSAWVFTVTLEALRDGRGPFDDAE